VNNSLAFYNCRTIIKDQVKDVVSKARTYLRQASSDIGSLAPTGTVSIAEGGVLVLQFATYNSIQVVQIDSSILPQFSTVRLVGYNSANSFLVINVVGTSGLRIENKNLAGLDATRTLWNLPEHSGPLVVRGIELLGSLLAPESDLVPSTGVIVGQTIVRSNGFAAGENLLSRPYSALQFNHAICVGLPTFEIPAYLSSNLNVADYQSGSPVLTASFVLASIAIAVTALFN
jgi:choice-of-anchor A domain-containing protein